MRNHYCGQDYLPDARFNETEWDWLAYLQGALFAVSLLALFGYSAQSLAGWIVGG